jgi:hypothetical protein
VRRLGIALLFALTLLTTGCSSEDPPGPAADPPPSDTGGEPTAEEPEEATEEPSQPLTYSTEGRTVISCFPDGNRRLMVFDDVETTRPVTLVDATVSEEADALRVTGAWLAELPRTAISEGGALDLGAGGISMADVDTWADRVPLEGAQLEPGTLYTFFVRVTVRPDRSLGDISLGWDDGDTTGAAPYDFDGRTRSGGC